MCGVDNTDDPDVLFVTDSSVFKYDRDKNPARFDQGAEIQGVAFIATGSNNTFALNTLSRRRRPVLRSRRRRRPGQRLPARRRRDRGRPHQPGRGAACGVIVAGGVDVGNKHARRWTSTAGAENARRWARPAEVVPRPPLLGKRRSRADARRRGARRTTSRTSRSPTSSIRRPTTASPTAGEHRGARHRRRGRLQAWTPGTTPSCARSASTSWCAAARPTRTCPGAVPQAAREPRSRWSVADGFRRRVLQAAVRPRNVGHRLDGDTSEGAGHEKRSPHRSARARLGALRRGDDAGA